MINSWWMARHGTAMVGSAAMRARSGNSADQHDAPAAHAESVRQL